jgi:hypothetical protein
LDPSKYIVQTLDKSGGPVFCNWSHYVVKSSNICDLMAFLFSYVMSRGDFYSPQGDKPCCFWVVQYVRQMCFVDHCN